jgi:hypothetical protein
MMVQHVHHSADHAPCVHVADHMCVPEDGMVDAPADVPWLCCPAPASSQLPSDLVYRTLDRPCPYGQVCAVQHDHGALVAYLGDH